MLLALVDVQLSLVSSEEEFVVESCLVEAVDLCDALVVGLMKGLVGPVVILGSGLLFPRIIVTTTVVTSTIIQTNIADRHRKYQSHVFRWAG